MITVQLEMTDTGCLQIVVNESMFVHNSDCQKVIESYYFVQIYVDLVGTSRAPAHRPGREVAWSVP